MIKKIELREKAIALRKKGVTYTGIMDKVPVAKSTLALWFKETKLSTPQYQRITEKRIAAMKRGWNTVRQNRIQKTKKIEKEGIKEAKMLINNRLWLAGVLLYWAEGSKEKSCRTGEMMNFSNMDPKMHAIFIKWALKYICSKDQLYYELYLHENSNIEIAKNFWCRKFNIDPSMLKLYFKKDKKQLLRKNNGNNYFGLLRIGIRRSVDLNRKIAGWIKGVVRYI